LAYYRKETGKPRISYDDAVEEALCYGWIDSTVKALDSERFAQRFSPRKMTSSLSQMNRERIRVVIATKKMTKAGLDAIAHIFDPREDDHQELNIPPDILEPLNDQAWQNFQRVPETYQRIRRAFIESRKRHGEEMFRRSLTYFIKMTAKKKRFGFMRTFKWGSQSCAPSSKR
jgi:uncharacterized protein YdeI (YjbR/CyaY-like superfamily)